MPYGLLRLHVLPTFRLFFLFEHLTLSFSLRRHPPPAVGLAKPKLATSEPYRWLLESNSPSRLCFLI